MKKYILIACEESQTICKAFREAGAQAYSLDLQRCSGKHPEWHIRDDATPFLQGRRYFYTEDGREHHVPRWDLIIAHPPCTYLSKAYSRKVELYSLRWCKGMVAREFFQMCLDAKAEHVAVENPTPLKLFELPEPTQVVQPYEFGHPYSKRTLLWLRNLPTLMPTLFVQKHKQWLRHTKKAKKRAKTFEGLAQAMVQQWLPVI